MSENQSRTGGSVNRSDAAAPGSEEAPGSGKSAPERRGSSVRPRGAHRSARIRDGSAATDGSTAPGGGGSAAGSSPTPAPAITGALEDLAREYGQPEWPLAAYAGLVGTYLSAVTGFLVLTKKAGVKLPERIPLSDILLLAVATEKLSRVITKNWVTVPLRAPFTAYESPGGPGEVSERPRGSGLQMAIGELLTCPWCASQWSATILTCGLVLRPRLVRLLCTILATVAVADFLNLAYCWAEKRA